LSLFGYTDHCVTIRMHYGQSRERCVVRSGTKTSCVIHEQLTVEQLLIISVHSYIKDADTGSQSTAYYCLLMTNSSATSSGDVSSAYFTPVNLSLCVK
jgi:hypothetical protein